MLPSTGYFKTINCPFYDSGLCERPYCHFKHPRKDDGASVSAIVGATTSATVALQALAESQSGGVATVATPNPNMLQQLVSEAVKKVLAHQQVTDKEKVSENIVSQVVEGLKPTLGTGSLASTSAASLEAITTNVIGKHTGIPSSVTKPVPCVYNPTPIAELKKRHIPVASYMPTRESRVAVKRKISPDRIKPWLRLTQDTSSMQETSSISGYSSVKVDEVTYKPTAISASNEASSTQSYVPTMKSDSSSPSNSYEDSNSNDYTSKIKEAYYPKSKKRREEYVPKSVKAPLKIVQHLDETVLDEFEPEFNMIDEILIAEKTNFNASASEDSQKYNLNTEPKFSDDELTDENVENSTKEVNKLETNVKNTIKDMEEKENEGKEHKKVDTNNSNRSDSKSNQKFNTQSNDKPSNIDGNNKSKCDGSSSKSRERKDTHSKDRYKYKEKSSGDNSKKNIERSKREHESSSKNYKRDISDNSNQNKSNKNKHKHSTSDKRHSSSSGKDRDKKQSQSSKDASMRSKHSSKSDKKSGSKDSSSRDHRSSRDRHKVKSSSKVEKHSLAKNYDRRHSRSSRRSSDSKRKVKKLKENSSDGTTDREIRSDSPAESIRSISFGDEILEISDSDHDVEEECLKIFQEYEVSDHPKEIIVKEAPKRKTEEFEDLGKKRIAHASASTTTARNVGPNQPAKKLPNPQQRMYERWRLMREAAAEKAAEKAAANIKLQAQSTVTTSMQQPSNIVPVVQPTESNSTLTKSEPQCNENGRVRIAHVPYAMSLAQSKKKITENIVKAADSKTVAQTSKGGSRVAHIPQAVPQLVRPEPLQVATQKFPLNVRQYYVNAMQDICMQIYTNGEDAAQRALREEFACHERCKAVIVYKNSCMLAVHRLRKELDQGMTSNGSGPSASGMVSHEAVLAGKSKGSWSVEKIKKSVTDFKGTALYAMLTKWIMTEQQLRDNGFPRPHPNGPTGRAKIYTTNTRNKSIVSKVPNERFCSRCGQSYMVNKNGVTVQQQNCIYHWGRKFTIRGEGRYSCCQQYGSATGCCDAKSHVWDVVDYENLRGYVKTLPKDITTEEQGIYALDCEMCYTTQGLELTRVTVINEDCNVIYETLVKPQNPIIDHNTRFSGITEENMTNVTTTLLDVQATLLAMFSEKTILVGHSLESDFKALKLIHDTVVDTSIMFPHKHGYPQKRALKNLCSEYLRKIIQNDVGGHDSKEDAVACMELIIWKVKEEAKLQ